jgi:hypothetical protein
MVVLAVHLVLAAAEPGVTIALRQAQLHQVMAVLVVYLAAVAVAAMGLTLWSSLVLAVMAVLVTVAFILGEVNHDTFCNN